MPIALDPEARVEVVLAPEAGPAEGATAPGAAVVCRFLTARQLLRVEQRLAEAHVASRADKTESAVTLLLEALAEGVVGWKHMPGDQGDFAVAKLAEVLTVTEMFRLAYQMMSAVTLGEIDRKNFGSGLGIAGNKSVDAPTADPVSTPPAN